MCDCQFDPYDDDPDGEPEESWHHRRTCAFCGHVWWGLHCPHDGYQNPCRACGKTPNVVPEPTPAPAGGKGGSK